MQQIEQEEKQYVLLSASHGYRGKKLHWVVAKKRKRDNWFLRGKPADSLCGLHASQLLDQDSRMPHSKPVIVHNEYGVSHIKHIENNDFFFQYTEDELFEDLTAELQRGVGKIKRKYWVDDKTGQTIDDITTISVEDLKNGRVRLVTEYRTPEDIKQEGLWCKQCQKKKAELYPDL